MEYSRACAALVANRLTGPSKTSAQWLVRNSLRSKQLTQLISLGPAGTARNSMQEWAGSYSGLHKPYPEMGSPYPGLHNPDTTAKAPWHPQPAMPAAMAGAAVSFQIISHPLAPSHRPTASGHRP